MRLNEISGSVLERVKVGVNNDTRAEIVAFLYFPTDICIHCKNKFSFSPPKPNLDNDRHVRT